MTALGILGVLALLAANAFFVIAEYALLTAPRAQVEDLAQDGRRGAAAALRLLDDLRASWEPSRSASPRAASLGAVGVPMFSESSTRPSRRRLVRARVLDRRVFSVVLANCPEGDRAAPRRALAAWSRARSLLQRVVAPLAWVCRARADPAAAAAARRPRARRCTPSTSCAASSPRRRTRPHRGGRGGDADRHLRLRGPGGRRRHRAVVDVISLDASLIVRDASPGRSRRRTAASPHPRVDRRHRRRRRAARPHDALHAVEDHTIEPLARELLVVPRPRTSGRCCRSCARRRADGARRRRPRAHDEIVTLNDLIEEIVGEIEEEYGLPDESVQELPDHRLRVSGTFTSDDFNETFDTALPTEASARSEGSSSPSRRAPGAGRRHRRRRRVTVEHTEGPRIDKLLVRLPAAGRELITRRTRPSNAAYSSSELM